MNNVITEANKAIAELAKSVASLRVQTDGTIGAIISAVEIRLMCDLDPSEREKTQTLRRDLIAIHEDARQAILAALYNFR